MRTYKVFEKGYFIGFLNLTPAQVREMTIKAVFVLIPVVKSVN